LLGAESVLAVDIDPQALTVTAANAAQNGVSNRMRTGSVVNEDGFDVLLANILAAPLIDKASWLSARLVPQGFIALSGILVDQANDVREAYRRWIEFAPTAHNDNWVRLAGRKR
jgi:ribosomal protein L11 methyltransferase